MTDVAATTVARQDELLTGEALDFLERLHRRFGTRRTELLAARTRRGPLGFLDETAHIRNDDSWRVATAPADLTDRRVEITGPTEPKMAINALNSDAKVWLADLEDANTPAWHNVVGGQATLYDAVRRTLEHTSAEGKHYRLADGPHPTIVVRPRGWHLEERHLTVDGEPIAGALVDFGLHFFHNAAELLKRGSGPYFYLPKTESHHEAALWADVFAYAEQALQIEPGTIRATVLIETLPAAFQMDEILYALRACASGLNAGRWDYLFSAIKVLGTAGPEYVLPDRAKVTMTAPFMRAYTELLVKTCHRRGAFAMGGMAAFIPNRRDPEVTATALDQVRRDKEREASDGFDGSWVAHPDLIPICREVFDGVLGDAPNQLGRQRDDVSVSAADLLNLAATPGDVTAAGVRTNVDVGLRYLAAWLAGGGAVAINNLMEDAATAEICRAQLWQWVRYGVTLDTGETVTSAYVESIIDDVAGRLPDDDRHRAARRVFTAAALADEPTAFLTLPAYDLI